MNEYLITRLEKNDILSLKMLIKEAFSIELVSENIENSLNSDNKIYLIAKNNKEVVGHILIDIVFDTIKNVKLFYLGYVCVKNEYKGRGIGTMLLKEVENLARKNNVDIITFTSSFDRCSAHNLYKKNNYQIKDTAVFIKNLN